MKKVLFFPYHPDLWTLIDHKDSLKDYQLGGFISFKDDQQRIHMLNQALCLSDASYEQLIECNDAVIILDNYRYYELDKYYEVIEDAINRQKEVFITPLAETQLDLTKYQGKYRLLESQPDGMESIEEEYTGRQRAGLDIRMYEIDTPIIAVIGQGKNCDKFKTQLLLKAVIDNEYITKTVATNALGVLFGCYTLPSFLYSNLPFQDKIVRFNYFIYKLSKSKGLDVIILGIPEGIAPFKKKEFHHFAEFPLIAASAVQIDLAILTTYFIKGKESELKSTLMDVAEYCQNRFNISIGAIAISRTHFDIPSDDLIDKIAFEYLSNSFLHKYYPNVGGTKLPIISMIDRDQAVTAIKMCLRTLEENVNVV